MDELARYNIERWKSLVDAEAVFTRPALDLSLRMAQAELDPERRLGDLAGKDVLCRRRVTPMETLTVLYDARCELCRRARRWLEAQPSYVQLDFVAAGSELARRRYPALDHSATLQELTVVSDTGEVYSGAHGWLMCLWALRDYRAWSLTLSSPALMPRAQRFITWVSQNRWRLGTRAPEICDVEGGCQIGNG